MLASLRKRLAWNKLTKSPEKHGLQSCVLLNAYIGLLEEIFFWNYAWLSLSFIAAINIIFFICVYKEINLMTFIVCLCITMIFIDAFEAWLKYKHRTSCLKQLSTYDGKNLKGAINHVNQWLHKQWNDFVFIRERNQTKAYLLANIVLGLIFIIGKYISGYTLVYLVCTFICISHKVICPIMKFCRNVCQDIGSESEFEGLIPEITDVDIQLLSIEAEQQLMDEKQSLDYWKPNDIPLEEVSDSSENSSSIVTSFSADKINTLDKDIETSDSSEDEYIPLEQQSKEQQLQTTLQVLEANTWSSSAYNAFWNITGAVANLMGSQTETIKRKRESSGGSSDGFEMVDKNDFN